MYKDFKKSESLDTGFVGGSGIIWMFSGIVLGLLVGLGMYYFSNDKGARIRITDSLQKKIEDAQFSKSNASELNTNEAKKANTQQRNSFQNQQKQKQPKESRFSYYAVLPTLDVPVGSAKPIETRTEAIKPTNVESDKPDAQIVAADTVEDKKQVEAASIGDYLLQVASFKKQSMADKTRGRLNNQGIDAYVQKKKVKGRFWYRVVAGPVDQTSVDNWKITAQKLGHNPLVISVR